MGWGGGGGREGEASRLVVVGSTAICFHLVRFCFQDEFSCEDFRAYLEVKISELKLRCFLSFYIRRT